MRIICYRQQGSSSASGRVGALLEDAVHVVDLGRLIDFGETNVPVLSWMDLDGEYLPKAINLLSALGPRAAGELARRSPRALLPLSSVELLAPVPRPGKVICIGLNYRDHAEESRMPVPKSPVSFSKYVTSVTGPLAPVYLPAVSQQVDYEAEMAVVIGRRAKHVGRDAALEYVLGYTNFNDVSARDLQFADGQWQRGKACDTFAPIGPSIVTTDEVPDPHALRIQLRLNGQTMQDSTTQQLIFGVDELVSFLSQTTTLEPGDIIATGTPPGVGFARKPPVFIKPGDVMEVEVEGLGVLRNPVAADPA